MINQRTLFVSQASTPKLHAGFQIGVRMNVNPRKHMGMQKTHTGRSLARRNEE